MMNSEDLPFRHYTLRHRMIAWISSTLFDGVIYTVRHGLLKGMTRKGGLGWLPECFSGAERLEDQFWRSLDLRGLVVYDLGAFHGLLTLFFARQAREVISFEPSRSNRNRLEKNVRLNSLTNVTIRDVGVGSKRENLQIVSWALMPGGATGDAPAMKNLLQANVATYAEVIRLTTLDNEIDELGLPKPDFIKIDIEGMELEALYGAVHTLSECGPALFLEMHGETMNLKKKKVNEIIGYLVSAGYKFIEHVETGTLVGQENAQIAAEGHLYAYQALDVRARR